jgi:hypothetical protein
MSAWLDVTAALADRRRPLEHHLPEQKNDRGRHVVAIREERSVTRVAPELATHTSDRQDGGIGLAGEDVAAARATVAEDPDPARVSLLDLDNRIGPGDRLELSRLFLEIDGLRCSGLRGEIRLPLEQLVGSFVQPPREVGCGATAHCLLKHGIAQAIDLEKEDSRVLGLLNQALAPRHTSDDT